MPNKDTPNNEWEQQYKREYKRIIQAINRQKKLGYYVPEEIRPIKPSKIKTVTRQDVQSLIDFTPQKIRKSSVYIDTETGEAFPGLDVVNSHHKAKPSKAKVSQPNRKKPTQGSTKKSRKKKQKTETPIDKAPPKENNLNMQIIDNINTMLAQWNPAPYWHGTFLERKTENYHKISTLWREILDTEGEYEVAYRLEANASEIIRLLERLLYSSDSTIDDDFNMGRFIELLIGRALTAIESDMYTEMAREAALDSLRGENSLG